MDHPINEFLESLGEDIVSFPHCLQIDFHIWAVGYLKQMEMVAYASKKHGKFYHC